MRRVEIRVQGRLDPEWEEWFQGFEIDYTCEGETILAGQVSDQSELYGILMKVRNLGLPLLSLVPLDREEGEKSSEV